MEAEDAEDFDVASYDVEASSKKPPLPVATTTITNEQQTELKTVTGVVSGEAANSGEEKLLVSTYLRSLSTDSTCNVIEMGDSSGGKLLSSSPPQCNHNHNHNHIHHNHHLLQHHSHQNHRHLCEDGDDGEEDEVKRKIKRKAMAAADANNQMEPIVLHANKGMLSFKLLFTFFLYLKSF